MRARGGNGEKRETTGKVGRMRMPSFRADQDAIIQEHLI